MIRQENIGYESPKSSICELLAESVLCTSTGIEELTVKDNQIWEWED